MSRRNYTAELGHSFYFIFYDRFVISLLAGVEYSMLIHKNDDLRCTQKTE